jgi:photosystem II stability/assembly factor-like uncharacterized protein
LLGILLGLLHPCCAAVKGDLNGDGRLDLADAILTLQIVAGRTPPGSFDPYTADQDGDHRVTVGDVVRLLRLILGLDRTPPDFEQSQWTDFSNGPSSPVYSLAWDDQTRTLWAAAPGQNLFRSSDNGNTWKAVFPSDPFVFAFYQNPANPKVLLVGTVHSLLLSEDGGETWSEPAIVEDAWVGTVYAFAADLNRPHRLYAAGSGAFRSDDDGKSWQALPIDLNPLEDIHALAADPWHPDRLLVGTRQGRVLQSDDGGDTWEELEGRLGGLGYRIFAFLPDPFHKDRWYLGSCNGGLWRSDDGGHVWTKAGEGSMPPNVNALLADPMVAGRLYAGTSTGPLMSEDGGDTWRFLGQGLERYEVLSMTYGPTRSTLYAGTWTAEVGVHRIYEGQ